MILRRPVLLVGGNRGIPVDSCGSHGVVSSDGEHDLVKVGFISARVVG